MKAYPKMIHGRGGLPAEVVTRMYGEYQSGLSLAEVGARHNRTRQAIYCIFLGHKVMLRARNLQRPVVYQGRKYTVSKGGYLRDTITRLREKALVEPLLHRRIWVEHNGPIPEGHQVMFKDGNKRNFAIDNLFCAPLPTVVA